MNAIIDTDPGVDDLLAILLALRSPELRIEALTTGGGNCSLSDATRNALRIIELAGRMDIPVYRGSARPLRGSYRFATHFHGPRGMAGRLPEPKIRASSANAIKALAARMGMESPPVTLIALGPLTNLARLLARHPECAKRISNLIVMGGAVDAPGNVTPFAEFNTWCDPEAAELVFRSGLDMTLIGLDVCNAVKLPKSYADRTSGPVGRVLRSWFKLHGQPHSLTMADVLAVAAACDPSLFTYERIPLRVITEGEERGRTVRAAGGVEIKTAMKVDAARTLDMFRSRLLD